MNTLQLIGLYLVIFVFCLAVTTAIGKIIECEDLKQENIEIRLKSIDDKTMYLNCIKNLEFQMQQAINKNNN